MTASDDGDGRRVVAAGQLVLGRDTGLWAVSSSSRTVYYLDLGGLDDCARLGPARTVELGALLLRSPGPGSSTGPWDGCWLALVSVEDGETQGRASVGRRHLWTMDPGGSDPFIWWLQRTVTAIRRVEAGDRPPGRAPRPGEARAPFGDSRHDVSPDVGNGAGKASHEGSAERP